MVQRIYEPWPGDIILLEAEGNGLYRKAAEWLLGTRWTHIVIFYDHTKRGLPLVIESIGKGVMIRSIYSSEGRHALVLRHRDRDKALEAAKRAERLSDNPISWYDYWAIPRYVLPRLIFYKIFGRRHSFGYRRNPFFICSELIDEAYGCIVPENRLPPLPQDFLAIPEFLQIWEGKIASKGGIS